MQVSPLPFDPITAEEAAAAPKELGGISLISILLRYSSMLFLFVIAAFAVLLCYQLVKMKKINRKLLYAFLVAFCIYLVLIVWGIFPTVFGL